MNRKKLSLNFKSTIPLHKERKEVYTHSKLELPTLANGSADSEMEMVDKFGQTGLTTKECGETTEPTVWEGSSMLMAIFMKEIGSTIKQMVKVFTSMSTALDMREIGKMIFNMDMAKKLGRTALFTTVSIRMVKNTGMEFIAGMMALDIQGNGLRTRLKD
jgi:hypothetical protein